MVLELGISRHFCLKLGIFFLLNFKNMQYVLLLKNTRKILNFFCLFVY